MQNRFFAMLARMKLIRRWGLMFSTRDENLSEHSLDTAFFMHALLSLHNRRFLTPREEPLDLGIGVLLAIYHDAAEILTGDLPTPIKYYNPDIRDAYREVEQFSAHKLLHMLPEALRPSFDPLLREGYDPGLRTLVKAADKLSAHIKCVEELKAGNAEFKQAAEQTLEALRGYGLPELDYFLEHFLPAFGLTLDELQ